MILSTGGPRWFFTFAQKNLPAMDLETKAHWETVFGAKEESELSWFQPYPKTSMEFLSLFELPITANI
jgi:hypothetical protein